MSLRRSIVSWGFLLQLLAIGTAVAATDPPLPPDDTHKQYDPSVLASVLAYATTDNETYVKDLFDLVAIPSISALPDHANDVLTAAGWLKLRMVAAGLENVQVVPTEGAHPVVGAGKPEVWLLFFGGGVFVECVLAPGPGNVQVLHTEGAQPVVGAGKKELGWVRLGIVAEAVHGGSRAQEHAGAYGGSTANGLVTSTNHHAKAGLCVCVCVGEGSVVCHLAACLESVHVLAIEGAQPVVGVCSQYAEA
jgi:hypothetical protein